MLQYSSEARSRPAEDGVSRTAAVLPGGYTRIPAAWIE